MPQPNSDPYLQGREMTPGPVFRIGQTDVSQEVMIDGERRFFWHVGERDNEFSKLAKWDVLDPADEGDGIASITIPEGTRSASSALGGVEAWSGEKDQILDFISGYARSVLREVHVVDGGLSLDTVGITRGNERMFVVPPHSVIEEALEAATWYEGLRSDIEDVLTADPRKDELVAKFRENMTFTAEDVQ
jgi:hypothetical protein